VGQCAVALREMRVIYAVFLFSVVLYTIVAEQFLAKAEGSVSLTFVVAFTVLAVLNGLVAQYFRRKKLVPSLEKLRRNPGDVAALKEWRFSTLLSLVLAEPIALLGVALRALGGGRNVAWPFFAAALILLLIWRPQLEFDAEAPGSQAG